MGTLLGDDGFRVALIVALLGALAVWGATRWWATRTYAPLPIPIAAVTVVAVLAGLRAEHRLTFSLALGLAFFGIAAWASRAGAGLLIGGVAVLAGTVILLTAYPDALATWVLVVVFVALVPLAPVLELRARRWDRLAPVALFGAIVGVYLCVPDTELVRPLLGAALVTACLAFLPDISFVQVGSGVVVAYTVWAIGIEGVGRPGSVIGAIGCVAALVLFPVSPSGALGSRTWWARAVVVALLVLWCSRVAGVVHSAWLAVPLLVIGFAVAAGARLAVRNLDRR